MARLLGHVDMLFAAMLAVSLISGLISLSPAGSRWTSLTASRKWREKYDPAEWARHAGRAQLIAAAGLLLLLVALKQEFHLYHFLWFLFLCFTGLFAVGMDTLYLYTNPRFRKKQSGSFYTE